MKHFATLALVLNLGAAGLFAQQVPVQMKTSGTGAPSTISLNGSTSMSEYRLAGNGTLGPFTFRAVSATANPLQPSSACPSGRLYFAVYPGAGVLRFQDGSLLTVNLTEGTDCIDLAAQPPHATCIRAFQVTGGTGRFEGASGAITLTMTVTPVLADATNHPAFFSVTGEITGLLYGVGMPEANGAQQ